MPRSQSRPFTAGCRSCRSSSKLDTIRSQKQHLLRWKEVGLKPILKEIHYAEGQATFDYEKASTTIRGVKEKAFEAIRKFFKPIEDVISAKNKKARESLGEKEKKIMNEQNRLKNFIEREEAKYRRDFPDFDTDAFLEETERLKLSISELAIRESIFSVTRVEINEMEEAVDRFYNQIQQALKTIKPDELFGIRELKQEFKARITTPPETCTSTIGSQSSHSRSKSTITPHPPSRSKSACSNSQKSSSPPSTKTSCSMEVMKDTKPQRHASMPNKSTPPSERMGEVSATLRGPSADASQRKSNPTISVSPQKSKVNALEELDHPYGVGALSDGNIVVVETNALKTIDKHTNEIVRLTDMYNREEAKATGCCDLTVLPNDDVIVCDSIRRKLLRVRAGEDQYEIFMAFDKGMVPKAVANDGEILYICLGRESEDGVVEKMDIETKDIIGRIVLKYPTKSLTLTGASVCTRSEPKYVAVNSHQELLVSDALSGVLWFIDSKDSVHSLTRACIPELSRPTGICWLNPARFVVAVQDNRCHQLLVVHIIDMNNINVVNRYGRRGDRPNEFNSPEGMAVHRGHDHNLLLVCDLMNSRLNTIPLSFLEDASSV